MFGENVEKDRLAEVPEPMLRGGNGRGEAFHITDAVLDLATELYDAVVASDNLARICTARH